MAVGSLVSRGTGFLRTLVITAALGAAVGDAYTTAQILPGMVYEFLLGGVLTSVLIPVLVRRRDTDRDRGELVHPAAAEPRGARPVRGDRARAARRAAAHAALHRR